MRIYHEAFGHLLFRQTLASLITAYHYTRHHASRIENAHIIIFVEFHSCNPSIRRFDLVIDGTTIKGNRSAGATSNSHPFWDIPADVKSKFHEAQQARQDVSECVTPTELHIHHQRAVSPASHPRPEIHSPNELRLFDQPSSQPASNVGKTQLRDHVPPGQGQYCR